MMLFPAVLINFPNSKVCLIGEWSIVHMQKRARWRLHATSKGNLPTSLPALHKTCIGKIRGNRILLLQQVSVDAIVFKPKPK